MLSKLYISECSSETYLGCMEKGLFGSNKPWHLQVVKGDYWLLQHFDAGSLFGLWKADSNGGRNLVPKTWNGKFPYQVKVAAVIPKIAEVTKDLLAQFHVDPIQGRFDNLVEEEQAKGILQSFNISME